MIFLLTGISALVTAALFALGFAILTGIEEADILLAVGLLGAAMHTALMVGWYLYRTRPRKRSFLDQRDRSP